MMSVLFTITMEGSVVLYKMLQVQSILDMKVTGLVLLDVSITSMALLGDEDVRASAMTVPEADQVNASICPGVSIKTCLDMVWASSNFIT